MPPRWQAPPHPDDQDGYLSQAYAQTLAHLGTPRRLPRSGGWILARPIPGTDRTDGMGVYPFLCCRDWSALADDLEELSDDLVCVSLVTDPFAPVSAADLDAVFDLTRPFKVHQVADLSQPTEQIVSRHRLRFARRALERLDMVVSEQPRELLEDWLPMYDGLVRRHGISGVQALTPAALEQLMEVPGLVGIRADLDGEPVGMHLELHQGDVVYGHLSASSELGYRVGVSSALHLFEIEHFRGRAAWIGGGGAAGLADGDDDGLVTFKRGFANATRTVHLCGRVFDPAAYARLSATAGSAPPDYFPRYRHRDFT